MSAHTSLAVEHGAELAAVMRRRVGDGVVPQKTVSPVDADMQPFAVSKSERRLATAMR